ncbi:MAG: hypothetical protein QOF83_3423 [Solirubrobacteraceae bacterium]|nr:hypothetical protein [Solirubrobacteraceae bacterium]
MLVIRRHGELELITQPAHAAVAGGLAQRWGSGSFSAVVAHESLVCAALHHDDGWLEIDGQPGYNASAARPAHFTEVRLAESVGPYGRGVESVYERDPLAGALCSMHWSGFSTSRWGTGGNHQSEDPLAQQVIASQEARWMPALRAAWGNRGRRSQFDARTWHAYEVLQAVDLLSLGLGLMDTDVRGNGSEPVAVAASLTSIDQEASARTIHGVPLTAGPEVVTLTLEPLGGGHVALDPYPLNGGAAYELTIPVRRILDQPYTSAEKAAAAYHDAEVQTRRVTLSPRAD